MTAPATVPRIERISVSTPTLEEASSRGACFMTRAGIAA